jgi:ribosomal 30S subunit maturation factor RimM
MDDVRPEEEAGFDPEIEWRFLEGDEVVGSDGEEVGIVVGFYPEDTEDGGRPDFLVVDHSLFNADNLYVPFEAVDHYEVDTVVLKETSTDVPNLGWEVVPV